MNEAAARSILLVRAIESQDAGEAVLSREDRRDATAAALAQTAPLAEHWDKGSALAPDEETFLARRAAFAAARLEARFPETRQACKAARWPRWLSWAVPAAAFFIGAAANELGNDHRINIIAFPLLGMLAWNAMIYLLLLIGPLFPAIHAGGTIAAAAAGLRARMGRRLQRRLARQEPLARGLAQFIADWLRFSAPLTGHRVQSMLHLSAALLAAGMLAGMYVRGLSLEYLAGWESTFIDEHTLHRMLRLILGPASALTGIALPGPDHLAAIRWNAVQPGENAARWIHLYATTAALFIIAPRLLLCAWHAMKAARLARDFPLPDAGDPYLRRLLTAARGQGSLVRVIPYSYHPSAAARQGLQTLLADVLGDAMRMELNDPIPYGGEDEYLAAAASGYRPAAQHVDQHVDHIVALFNLAATPESETHGAFIQGMLQASAPHEGAGRVLAVLDESVYRHRLAGQAGAADRIDERRASWKAMLARYGVEPLFFDLGASALTAQAEQLEAAIAGNHRPRTEPGGQS